MPVSISVSLDAGELRSALRELGPRVFRQAANQSINKAATGARTDATRHLAPKSEVKRQKDIRDKITVTKSNVRELVARVEFDERNIPLTAVKNVRVAGKGKKQTVRWKGKKIKGAWRPEKMRNLSRPIMVRTEKRSRRNPGGYHRGFAYTLLQSYRKFKTADHLEKTVGQRLNKEFARQVNRRLKARGFR